MGQFIDDDDLFDDNEVAMLGVCESKISTFFCSINDVWLMNTNIKLKQKNTRWLQFVEWSHFCIHLCGGERVNGWVEGESVSETEQAINNEQYTPK